MQRCPFFLGFWWALRCSAWRGVTVSWLELFRLPLPGSRLITKHIDDTVSRWLAPLGGRRLKKCGRHEAQQSPARPVGAEETGLSALTMLSEAATGSEERGLWLFALIHSDCCSLIPRSLYCLSPTFTPLLFILYSLRRTLRADKGMWMMRAGVVDCWADGGGLARIKDMLENWAHLFLLHLWV